MTSYKGFLTENTGVFAHAESLGWYSRRMGRSQHRPQGPFEVHVPTWSDRSGVWMFMDSLSNEMAWAIPIAARVALVDQAPVAKDGG